MKVWLEPCPDLVACFVRRSNLAGSICMCYHDGQPPGATAPFCLVHLALSWRPLFTVHHELIWHSSLLNCTLEPSSMLVLIAVPCWATSLSHCPALLGTRRFRLEFAAHCAHTACLAPLSVHQCHCYLTPRFDSTFRGLQCLAVHGLVNIIGS